MSKTRVQIIKWIAIALGSLAALGLIGLGSIYWMSNSHINRSIGITPHAVPAAGDSSAIAYGKRLAVVRGCTDCHGDNLAGKLFIDAPMVAKLYSSNLTAGKGGIGGQYTDVDWERAIRHGVGREGQPLIFMPAQEFFYLSDGDLAALVAYLKSLPPVDNELPQSHIGPIARVLYLKGELPLVPAELIDHQKGHPNPPQRGITIEFGRYMAIGCMGCHGTDFSGGPIPGAPPDWPPAANLTPSGNLKNWNEADFIRAVRTGVKPNGKRFQPQMPIVALNAMTDDELKAIWLFLKSLPAAGKTASAEYSGTIN